MKKIGMIGIGMMGHGIATNILKAGYELAVLEHPGNQPLDDLLAAGAVPCKTMQDVAAQAEAVLLCVTGTPQVEAVLLQPEGLLASIRPGAIIIDCSTAIPSSTERIAALVAEKGGRFIDAAMTRTPKEAAAGRLNLLVGGDDALVGQVRPLLSSFAEHVTHVGPVGAGHRMKLLHNYVSLGTIALICEASACASKAGIDPAILVDVLAKGGGGGTALERVKPYLLHGDTSSLRFTVANAHKDIGYYSAMAQDADSFRHIADAVLDAYGRAEAIDPSVFVPELAKLLNQET